MVYKVFARYVVPFKKHLAEGITSKKQFEFKLVI